MFQADGLSGEKLVKKYDFSGVIWDKPERGDKSHKIIFEMRKCRLTCPNSNLTNVGTKYAFETVSYLLTN